MHVVLTLAAGKTPGKPSGNQSRKRVKRSRIALLVFLGICCGSQAAFAITISSYTLGSSNVAASLDQRQWVQRDSRSNVVKFNCSVATVTAPITIKIIATVPSGAKTRRIILTVSGRTATSSAVFTGELHVLSLRSVRSPIGTLSTIAREGLGPTPANNSTS
jgi:hypothetical protein